MSNYVFDGTEVVLTKRTAIKTVRMSNRVVEDKLVEIQPADPEGPSWKKWVREADLYQIQDSSK